MPRDKLGRFTPIPPIERLSRRLDAAQSLCERAMASFQESSDLRLAVTAAKFGNRVLAEFTELAGDAGDDDA